MRRQGPGRARLPLEQAPQRGRNVAIGAGRRQGAAQLRRELRAGCADAPGPLPKARGGRSLLPRHRLLPLLLGPAVAGPILQPLVSGLQMCDMIMSCYEEVQGSSGPQTHNFPWAANAENLLELAHARRARNVWGCARLPLGSPLRPPLQRQRLALAAAAPGRPASAAPPAPAWRQVNCGKQSSAHGSMQGLPLLMVPSILIRVQWRSDILVLDSPVGDAGWRMRKARPMSCML